MKTRPSITRSQAWLIALFGALGAVLILAGLAVLALPRPRLRDATAGTVP